MMKFLMIEPPALDSYMSFEALMMTEFDVVLWTVKRPDRILELNDLARKLDTSCT